MLFNIFFILLYLFKNSFASLTKIIFLLVNGKMPTNIFMNKDSIFLLFFLVLTNLCILSMLYDQTAATLPYSQDFAVSNDFTLVNGTQPNKWFYDTATGNAPNSIYISNDNGATNGYNIASSSLVHASIPAGTIAARPALLSFDWKAEGQTAKDRLRVWLVPASYTPTGGTAHGTTLYLTL